MLGEPTSITVEVFIGPSDRFGCYRGQMITGYLIAEVAALVGEPARAAMLSALLDGRAQTASELAHAARVTPQTASTHLAKLTDAGLVRVVREGRHRYFRLASPKSRRDDRGHRRPCARKQTAIPPGVASSTRALRGPNLLRPPGRPSQRRPDRLPHGARVHRARRRSR